MNGQEVQATQSEENSSEDVTNTFTCYICDAEVPKTHMRMHLDGDKHQTCQRIANVALERARKQLSLEFQPLYEMDGSIFFCDPCSVVLLTTDKTYHEHSEAHKENVQYYNVLRSLSAFYTNDTQGTDAQIIIKYSNQLAQPKPKEYKRSDYKLNEYKPNQYKPNDYKPNQYKPNQYKSKEREEISKEAELQAVLNHLKEATAFIQSPGGSLSVLDPHLNKALNGLKITVDRTLHELQDTVARKESVFDKAINNLKESAERTLHDLKESAEIKHQTDVERSKLSEEAELEIYKFKNKLSRMNLVRKNRKKTNLPPIKNCDCDPEKTKKTGPSTLGERMRATFGTSPKAKKTSPK